MGRQITKKKAEYRDPNSTKALSRLNDSLNDVSSVMRENINNILQRGEALESVGNKADKLKNSSKDFKNMTRNLNLQTLIQKWAIPIVIVLFVLLILWWKLFKR